MMKGFSKILFLLVVCVLFVRCIKRDKFSNIPEIKYDDFILYGDLGNSRAFTGDLSFTFTDGDGDIGFKPNEDDPPYNVDGDHYYNFFMEYMVKEDGEFVKLQTAIPFYYRIPFIQPEGKNKSLQGTIVVRDITVFTESSKYDTIQFMFYIEDRALNKSNMLLTPVIIRPNI